MKWAFQNVQDAFDGHDYVQVNDDVVMCFGATRCAIVDRNYPYVVKFTVCNDSRVEDPCAREEERYEEAVNAGLSHLFCECQYLGVYEKQYRWFDYDDVIAEAGCVDEKDNELWKRIPYKMENVIVRIALYGYEKAQEFEYSIGEKFTEEEKYICAHNNSPVTERMYYLGVYVLRQYGEKTFDMLCDFCNEWDINDIHGGNVGWIEGKLVLTDYAGYY